MKHKALVRRLQISCLGLDHVDPLRLLVDDVIEALRENAMREVQRLGQEIEQEPVVGIAAIRTWFKDGRVVTQTLCNSWVDTTPPQRSESSGKPSAWVGLTDEEKLELWEISRAALPRYATYSSLVEAKLKEKNT